MITNNINTLTGTNTGANSAPVRQPLDENFQNFLKLLTVQLQHQDPTDPTDTNQLTQEIATLSQVEQQISTNKNLERLISMYNATQYNSVVSYIGKEIESPGNNVPLHQGQAPFVYYMQAQPSRVVVTVKDASGNAVYTNTGVRNEDNTFTWNDEHGVAQPASPDAGRNKFVWDGKNNAGQAMTDGVYVVEIKATDASNNPIASQTYMNGIVSAIDNVDGQVYLSLSDVLSIPIQNVTTIRQSTGTL